MKRKLKALVGVMGLVVSTVANSTEPLRAFMTLIRTNDFSTFMPRGVSVGVSDLLREQNKKYNTSETSAFDYGASHLYDPHLDLNAHVDTNSVLDKRTTVDLGQIEMTNPSNRGGRGGGGGVK